MESVRVIQIIEDQREKFTREINHKETFPNGVEEICPEGTEETCLKEIKETCP